MQINRLFEIVYILLDKKIVTAKELSKHFEVSVRTIYRDIDILSGAGIPIYTNKGKGGGISLIEDFVLNKSVLSEKEQKEILMSLQSLNAMKYLEVEPILKKLSTVFNKKSTNWIDVDFSHWGSNDTEKEKFKIIKTAILNSEVLSFDYFSSYGEKTSRIAEPLKLVFKGQGWYLYAYCRLKNEFRIFKLRRIHTLVLLNENFKREVPANIWGEAGKSYDIEMVTLVLRIDEKMAYRIFDEFEQENIIRNKDGSYTTTITFPSGEWIFGYIMSYGEYAEVIEPKNIRKEIKRKFEESVKKYS
ncbi:YafY family transcriptional regulator [Clostridium chromiireducens]|uniref:YafY family transcriptional regulator n=1 Tax=Clostridium chromiireducens TaxID=225345 RepID=A0A399IUK7_9CLOT|nr:YafY family protein [Clostridium chromiireducens]RII36704.1 YafY family transcriptional regulator [Clostridium chromiireducens]